MKCGLNRLFRAQVCMALALFNAAALLCGGGVVPAEARTIRIIAFGDSLTAGYRLRPQDAFPAQLQKALRAKGHDVEVINAGVSGDTTAAGLERLDWSIPDRADAVILELGANDALRGIDPAEARQNLDRILTRLKERGAEVLIAGSLAPRNLGADYVERFEAIFPDLARRHGALLHPFFLDGVVTRTRDHLSMNSGLVLEDGMHPNGKGVAAIVESIMPAVEQLLARVRARQAVTQTP